MVARVLLPRLHSTWNTTSHKPSAYAYLRLSVGAALVHLAQEVGAADEVPGVVGPIEHALKHKPVLPADGCACAGKGGAQGRRQAGGVESHHRGGANSANGGAERKPASLARH